MFVDLLFFACFIVLNFINLKIFPLKPGRFCTKNIGCPRIKNEDIIITKNKGNKKIRARTATNLSQKFFKKIYFIFIILST